MRGQRELLLPSGDSRTPPSSCDFATVAASGRCGGSPAAGIIDDIYGADFVNGGKDGINQDQNGHGTFVAGVVGAVPNDALGVVGINQVCLPPEEPSSYHVTFAKSSSGKIRL